MAHLEKKVFQERKKFFEVVKPSYLFWAAGSVSLVVGGIYGGKYLSAKDEMNGSQTQIEAWPHKEEAKRSALIANIFYGTGAGMLLSGTVWFAVDLGKKRKGKKSKSSIALTPRFASPEDFSLTLSFNY